MGEGFRGNNNDDDNNNIIDDANNNDDDNNNNDRDVNFIEKRQDVNPLLGCNFPCYWYSSTGCHEGGTSYQGGTAAKNNAYVTIYLALSLYIFNMHYEY